MGKNANVVAIIAICIGAVGLGLVIYNMIQPPSMDPGGTLYLLEKLTTQPEPGVKRSYLLQLDDIVYTNPIDTWITAIYLNVFTLKEDEHLYVCYIGQCVIPGGSGRREASVGIFVDGILFGNFNNVSLDPGATSAVIPISVQDAIFQLPGTYNVSIRVIGDSTGIYFTKHTLCAQIINAPV